MGYKGRAAIRKKRGREADFKFTTYKISAFDALWWAVLSQNFFRVPANRLVRSAPLTDAAKRPTRPSLLFFILSVISARSTKLLDNRQSMPKTICRNF